MAISQIGMIIRRRRMELGLSQEDLADGICAVTTLSRIENGERMPTQNHLETLLQRLGYSDMMLQSYGDGTDFVVHEMKFKIRQAYIENDATKAQELLQQFKTLVAKPTAIDEQFVLLYEVLLYPQRYSKEESLEELEKALLLTCPRYKLGNFPFLLSYEEIILLNNIATFSADCGHRKEAIDILYGIVGYYDTHIVIAEEAMRTETLVFYNLSKYLGLENRYDECVAICEQGIQCAKKTGRCLFFAQTLYNKAWALVKRNYPGDLDEAKEVATYALNVARALDLTPFAVHCQKFIDSFS